MRFDRFAAKRLPAFLGALVATAWGSATVAVARAQTVPLYAGPLPVRLRDGISGVGYAVEPRGGNVLPKGRSEAFYHLDIGNTSFELLGDGFNTLREDSETQNHRLGFRRGLGKGWEAGATLAFATRNGGITDGLINRWHHDILHFRDDFRESFPNDQTLLMLTDGWATTASAIRVQPRKRKPSRWRAANPYGIPQRVGPRILFKRRFAWASKIPLRDQQAAYYLDNGAVDGWAGLSVSGRARGRLWLHADASVVWAGTGHVLAFDNGKRFLPQAVFALEYKAGAKTSLLVQTENALYPFPVDLPNHSGRRAQTTFGLWQSVGPKTRLFGALSENIWGPRVTSYPPMSCSRSVSARDYRC